MVGIESGVASAVQPAGQVSKFGLLKIIGFSFLGIYITLLLINTIYIAVDQHSIAPVLKNLGDTFILSTQHISDISKEIIANDGGYIRTPDFWSGVWNYIKLYGYLYIYLYTLWWWFKILMWLYEHSPFSNDSEKFKTFVYTLLTFLLIQSIMLLSYAAISKSVDCFIGCEKSVVYWLELPVTWVWDFVRAIPLIIKPASVITQTVVGNSTIY